jgi:hypothetical protein
MDAAGWVCLWDSNSWCCLDMQRAAPLPPAVTPVLLQMVRSTCTGRLTGRMQKWIAQMFGFAVPTSTMQLHFGCGSSN